METQEAIRQRRSVKHYDPEHQMPEEDIQLLIELAHQSPTSFNMQNYRFLVATDPKLREQMREVSWNQAQVTEASIVVLVCADLKAWNKNPARYFEDAPEAVSEMLVPMIAPFYRDNPTLERDEAMRSAGIAGQTIMLAAKDMGYDSCPMIGFDPVKMAELVNLPEDHVIGFMITIGKALKPAWAKPGMLSRDEILIRETF